MFASKATFIALQKAFVTSAMTFIKRRENMLSLVLRASTWIFQNTAIFSVPDGGKNNWLTAVIFTKSSTYICNIGARQWMLRLLNMTVRVCVIHAWVCVPGRKGGWRGVVWREGRGRGPREGHWCFLFVEYLILFTWGILLRLVQIAGITMGTIMNTVTTMMMMMLAFIYLSVCIIK